MTVNELKYKLLSNDTRLSLGIEGHALMVSIEKLLLKNGWKWRSFRDRVGNISFLDNRPEYNKIILYLNYELNEPKILSMNSMPDDFNFNFSDIIVTEEIIRDIDSLLNPTPNYKPRKIIREI